MSAPTVGGIVHYTDNPVHGGGHARCRAAMITGVNPDGSVDLVEIVTPDALATAYAVPQGEPGELYTWHWPERTATS